MKTVSVIIVSYNVKEFLIQALNSLRKALSGIDAEIIVVDNRSVDGTKQMLPEKFPDIKLIANDENLGFARACNQGIRVSRGKYILLLNPDTLVQEDTVSVLLDFFKNHPEAGMLGCKILNADGTLQAACRRSFPTPSVALPKLLGLHILFPKSKIMGKYNLTYLDEDEIHEVDAISGSFMFVRRRVVDEVGLLDEDFFMYGEDLDWCYRIKQRGWKIYYVPLTKIIHYHGESSKLATFDSFIAFYRAMDLFVNKHFSKSYSVLIDIVLKSGIVARGIISGIDKLVRYFTIPLIDGAVVLGSSLIAIFLSQDRLWQQHFIIPLLSVYLLIWLGAGYVMGLYEKRTLSYSRALVSGFIGFIGVILFHFAVNKTVHPPFILYWSFLLTFLLLPGWRLLFTLLQKKRLIPSGSLISKTLFARNAIIVGYGEEGKRVAQRLQSHFTLGFNILGFVDKHLPGEGWNGYRFLGRTNYLPEIIRIHKATEVIFTTDRFTNEEILSLIDSCKNVGADFKIVPRQSDFIIGKSRVERIEDVSLLSVHYNLHQLRNRALKRILDVIISLPIVLVFSILVLPVLLLFGYRFKRCEFVGYEGNVFTGYILSRGEKKVPGWIKSLPLWFSVLEGKISIVGARLSQERDSGIALPCKPGLISFRDINETSRNGQARNFEHYYVQHYSIFLDIEIAFKSFLGI